MKKRNNKRALKRLQRRVITVLIAAAIVCTYFIFDIIADDLRGYNATGGEIMILLIPFIIVVAKDCFDEFINLLK